MVPPVPTFPSVQYISLTGLVFLLATLDLCEMHTF